MKILHLLRSNRFSGAENVVCQIVDMFQNHREFEMIYCSRDGQIREALAERQIPFVPIQKLSVKEVRRVLKEQKPDMIHAHDMSASFYAALACGKTPLISHIHNNAFNSRGFSPKSVAYAYAAKKAKHIFWVSQSSFEGYAFHKAFEAKSSVLYNIINIDTLYRKMELDNNHYNYDVVYVGRLTHPKNPQRLMKVFYLLKEKNPDVKIAVVGTGDLETETKALAKEYNLFNNVSFLGFMPNPLKLLYDSKVMVMTSRWEGTPMCALEAMALGVPIVSTPVDGLKDLVINGRTGYLSDDDSELVEKIHTLVTDEMLRERCSAVCMEKSKINNDGQKYKDELLSTYMEEV